MSHELQLIFNLTIAILIALMGGLAAHWLTLSPIVGYLVAGMLIGPFTPGFQADRGQISVSVEVGVIFLMFALGIEFSLRACRKSPDFGAIAEPRTPSVSKSL